MYFFSPLGLVTPMINICSANHPSSLAITEAILNAKLFFPRRAFPPYPLPNDQILFSSGKWTMYLCAELHGQETSSCPGFKGCPTECRQGINRPLEPS